MKLTKRKDGRWQYKYRPDKSKKVKVFYSSEPTERKAEREIINKIAAFSTESEKGITIDTAVKLWQNSDRYQRLAYQTAHRYESLTTHILDFFGGQSIKTIEPKDVDAFIKHLVGLGYSGKSIKDNKSVLKIIFDTAIVHGDIRDNPVTSVRIQKGLPKQTRDIPTKEEIQTILDNNNGMLGFLAKFLLFTGLRLGEALALSYADIDIENRLIRVNKSLYYMGNIPHIKTPKTISGMRSVFILDPILSDLKPNAAPTELLFPDENGGYLPKHKYVKPWNRWMKQMGIHVTAHQLRHAYASYILYDAKIDVKTAQKLLGHADTSTTMDIYTHVTESRSNEGFEQINKYVSKTW